MPQVGKSIGHDYKFMFDEASREGPDEQAIMNQSFIYDWTRRIFGVFKSALVIGVCRNFYPQCSNQMNYFIIIQLNPFSVVLLKICVKWGF